MAHKQLFGLKDQLGLVNHQLEELALLEAEAPKMDNASNFGVVMSATVVELSLNEDRRLLEQAAAMLQAEISFYEETDGRLAQAGDDSALIDTLTKEQAAREPLTAGRAAFCLQSVAAASIFKLKGMEKARSYRR